MFLLDFFVLARGIPKGEKKISDEIGVPVPARRGDHGDVRGRRKILPFGPRQDKSASTVFWTIQPLKDDPSPAAQQIAAAWNALEKDFGPLDKNIAARISSNPRNCAVTSTEKRRLPLWRSREARS